MKYLLQTAVFFAVLCSAPAGSAELPRPEETMSAEQIMALWYDIEFTRFARDYKNYNTFILIDRGGGRRERKAYRSRITLRRDGIDYKDFAVFLSPASIKGVAMLTWSYTDPGREREQWLYLPSMRKARRSSPAQDDDNAMGTVLTVEEMTSWRPEHERYRLLGMRHFSGYTSFMDGQRRNEGLPCFVIEGFPKRAQAFHARRTYWLRKDDGCCIMIEVFDRNEKLFKTIFRQFDAIGEKRFPAIVYLEAQDLRTGEKTVIRGDDITFDSGVDESQFTIDYLQRTTW
jgi:hypothetical protein